MSAPGTIQPRPALLRSRFRDKHYAGIEVPVFAGNSFIDRVGHDMGDPPPIPGQGEIAQPHHLLLGKNIPQAELDPKAPIGL